MAFLQRSVRLDTPDFRLVHGLDQGFEFGISLSERRVGKLNRTSPHLPIKGAMTAAKSLVLRFLPSLVSQLTATMLQGGS